MNTRMLLLTTLVTFAVLLSACGTLATPPPTATPTPAPPTAIPTPVPPTATPMPSISPPAPGLYLYFHDDFSDPTSGWTERATPDGEAIIMYLRGKGRLWVVVSKAGITAWSRRNLSLTDFTFEVDASLERAPSDTMNQLMNIYGVIFRYEDRDNYYHFGINDLGQFFAFRVEAGEAIPLRTGNIAAPNQGTRRIRIVAEGSRFDFYVDDEHLTDVTDSSFREGDIALAFACIGGPGSVYFDNAKLWVRR